MDRSFVETELEPALVRLKQKQEEGTLGLADYIDFLKVYRNVMIPAAMKQQIDRLNTIKELIKVAD